MSKVLPRNRTPKAIETEYNGYRFRSRLEARWAVFFDALGIRYEYEPEGIEFPDGTRYLPDFLLPELGVWAEIKGGHPNENEIHKAELLAKTFGAPVLLATSEHSFLLDKASFGSVAMLCQPSYGWGYGVIASCPHCKAPLMMWVALDNELMSCTTDCFACNAKLAPPLAIRSVKDAAKAARSARFEFGENGAPR